MAHPGVELLTGISGTALSKKQSANLLLNAVVAAGNAVSAYWLDDPGQTQACRRCTSAAATVLHGLRARGL